MSVFICPVCKNTLERKEKSYVCERRHSFDVAKSGYVNLFISQASSKKVHGDDKTMIRARSRFLDSGTYFFLADRLAKIVGSLALDGDILLDAGCGEGYYTGIIKDRLSSEGKECTVIGVDLSKDALMSASKRSKSVEYAISSVFDIPVASESVSVVWNIFAPLAGAEYARILKDGGYFIRVYPLAKHLMGLKEKIYKNPYENPKEDLSLDGFELVLAEELRRNVILDDSEIIDALFKMTPYYYKTSESDQKKLSEIGRIETPLAFGVALYRKS